jgi:hypothetical protein
LLIKLLFSLYFPYQQACCAENAVNKAAFTQELLVEESILSTNDSPQEYNEQYNELHDRLLRDHEEERLVDEFLKGRELQTGCAKACKNNPTGYWCLVVCKDGRRLADDNAVVAGVDTSVTTSTTTLRGSSTKSSKRAMVETNVRSVQAEDASLCTSFPLEIPHMMSRMVEEDATLQSCQLRKECFILRQCGECESV